MTLHPTARLAATAALVAGLVSAGPSEAQASTTYTPSGGPSLNLVGTNVAIWFEAGQAINCTDFHPSGTLTDPGTARPVGAPAGSIASLSSGCTTDSGASLTFTSGTWSFEVTGLATGTAWPVRFTGVELDWNADGCQVDMAGDLGGVFDTSTQRFMPTSSTITPTAVTGSGCASLGISPGDTTEFGGYLTNVPPTGSTALSLS
ncbi:hypothetical protein [Nocardioides sp. LML1-1-1.1]|uniref:hypothetical protein n=1 Tax=Nocardioides sp. LML1-1-1.1 TaxID=3135248 RepID=UPI003413BF7D